MFVNGIVIQKYADNHYKGIDGSGFTSYTGENWYFNSDNNLSDEFEPYYDEYINKTYYNMAENSWVSACNDMDYVYKYIAESEKQGIKYRLILCETEISSPVMSIPCCDKLFLGYDYAYATGENYSAVYNEIPFVFPEFKLNQNGLFQTESEIYKYIHMREEFTKNNPPNTLESGDFIVYRLHEIYL